MYLWTALTNLPKEKQAIAVHLTLQGRARQASSEIQADKLQCEHGMKHLMERLDDVFL